jgi:hypothetical protein
LNSKQAFKTPQVLDVCLPVYELRYGMFVSNVDCGWQKTPFQSDGLLITTPQQIATLGGLTEYVTVDPTRGQDIALKEYLKRTFGSENYHLAYEDLDTLEGITAIEPSLSARGAGGSDAAPGEIPVEEDDEEDHDPAAPRAGLLQQFGQWLRAPKKSPAPEKEAAPVAPRRPHPSYIPSGIALAPYPEHGFSWPALPVALGACDAIAEAIEQVFTGIAMRSISDVRRLERAADTLVEHMVAHPGAMMWAARMRGGKLVYQRSLETAIYLTALGRHLGLPRGMLSELGVIGMLLDLGKTKVDVTLLEKQGPYSGAELQAVRLHVDLGMAMLGRIDTLNETVLRAIAEHHEQVDGNGYPKGLRASKISLYGKMSSIADAFVAMVNPRPYAKALAPHDAIRQLKAGAEVRWFGPLVEEFSQAIGIYPVGSLVEMITGHVAIVVQHNAQRRLEPKILIVTHSDKKPRLPPLQIDMLRHNARQRQTRLQILKGLPEGAYGVKVRDFYFGRR